MKKIMIIDGDREGLTPVARTLETEGFEVFTVTSGQIAPREIERRQPHVVVLDTGTPGGCGLDLLSRIRRSADIPVLLTTETGDEIEEILALREGADDYLHKPFSPRLLLERIRCVLRRQARQQTGDTDPRTRDDAPILRGPLYMDPAQHEVTWKGAEVSLTKTEFILLEALIQHPGHVKDRDQLMDRAYGNGIYVEDRTVDSHIKRLRKKIRSVDPAFSAIQTVYGVGYRFKLETETAAPIRQAEPPRFRAARGGNRVQLVTALA